MEFCWANQRSLRKPGQALTAPDGLPSAASPANGPTWQFIYTIYPMPTGTAFELPSRFCLCRTSPTSFGGQFHS